jgi:hypothetical protein
MQLFEDGISGGGAAKRPAVGVAGRDEVVDALHDLFSAGEGSAPNGLAVISAKKRPAWLGQELQEKLAV